MRWIRQGKDRGPLPGRGVLSGPLDCGAAEARVGEGTAAQAACTAATLPVSDGRDDWKEQRGSRFGGREWWGGF